MKSSGDRPYQLPPLIGHRTTFHGSRREVLLDAALAGDYAFALCSCDGVLVIPERDLGPEVFVDIFS